jgi:hypothetical protein
MYEMDENELEAFIAKQQQTVAKLNYEKPGSGEYNHEAGILKDAKQLLKEKQKTQGPSDEVEF